ncbi:MAG: HAMP domain-containing protein, partial [Burkholderiales bacterium]|nr:HAMP domain-containing protein [Burkholderiales bacterium]
MGALREIRTGQYAVDLPADEPGELGELQRAIVDMAGALSTARHNLEAKVAARTVELQAAVDAARIANEERSQLIARSHAQIEEERERIARELHDELGSMLVALRLKAQHI